jgi:hypothetical protein
MAKYDIRHYASSFGVATATPSVTFAGSPVVGDIIVLAFGAGFDAVTVAPSGFTLLDAWDGSGDAGKISFYAKLAGGSEPATYSATVGSERLCGGVGYVVEGPFASLAALTWSARQPFASGSTTVTVLTGATSLAQAGTALAFTAIPYGASAETVSTWSNSFTGRARGGGISAFIDTASRVYPAADAGVQTVATFTGAVFTSAWLARITEAGGGGGGPTPAPSFGRYGVRGPVR